MAALHAGALLIFDLGYTNFQRFAELTAAYVTFITRAKRNLAYDVIRTCQQTAQVHDRLIWIGQDATRQPLRLIEILYRGTWYRYLTNQLDPRVLPPEYVVALYWQRWRIEDAYAIVKRLLGLADFWTGSENGVCLQLWATWLLYAVLVDLTDAVADALNQPFAALSLEMVYRSLYHFTQAYTCTTPAPPSGACRSPALPQANDRPSGACHRGEATDVVVYLATNAQWLGIIKRKRKTKPSSLKRSPLTASDQP